ncbi:acetyltransferase [Vibrio sp. Vb2880]|nr:acetyltransferase [Vibrio sp. Vb2880]
MVAVVVFEFSVTRCQPLRRALYSFMNFGVYIQSSLANGA